MTSITLNSALQKDKAGLQELPESMLELDQLQDDAISLYNDSLQGKEAEQVDNLDDSLCGGEDVRENDCVVPDKEDLTQVTSSDNITEQLVSGEKGCSLVDELFDDLPIASQSATSSDSTVSTLNESFDKKIAPLFSSTKKKKRFRTPVQSVVDEKKCKQVDIVTNVQSSDTKAEKAKPVFKSAAKSSIGKKRKLSEISKDGDEKISEPPVTSNKKKLKSDQAISTDETKEVSKEKTVLSSVKKISSTATLKASSAVDKKKKQKKVTEGMEDDQPSDEMNEASEKGMVISSNDSAKKVSSTTSEDAAEKANKRKKQKKVTEGTEDDQPLNTNKASEEGMVLPSNDSGKKVSSAPSEEAAEKANKKKRQKKTMEGTEEANSIQKANTCKQLDEGKTDDTKTEKAKPSFKPGTKKQKSSETSKGGKEKISEPPVKSDTNKENSCQSANNDIDGEVNFNIKGDSTNDSMKKASLTTGKEVSSIAGKANKKKRQKKAVEDKEGTNNGTKKSKKEVDASIKKAAQQQAKIDKSFKDLDREQRKAEKELQKISRELKKVRKQKSSKDKETVETYQPLHSGSSGQLWVQCDQPDCLKWRRLRNCKNPSEIPEQWFCSMNPDQQFNSCAVPEEDSSELSDSQEYVYATYAPGAIVWAKITGYPWWPAMVQYDTNKDTFYEKHPSCHTPIAYHVVFFGKPVSRAWVHSLCLQAFEPDENPNTKVPQKYNSPLRGAVKEADEACLVSVEERLAEYSFDKLYTGKTMYIDDQWASTNGSKETRRRKRGVPKKTQQLSVEDEP